VSLRDKLVPRAARMSPQKKFVPRGTSPNVCKHCRMWQNGDVVKNRKKKENIIKIRKNKTKKKIKITIKIIKIK
jgi:hypothetical protein